MKRILLLWLILSTVTLAWCTGNSEEAQAKADFWQCLTDAGLKMYGASWCKHCKDQKELFGIESFETVDYVECTKKKTTCDLAWVTSYPTWIWSGYKQSWVHSFEQLSKVSWCPSPLAE